MPLDTVVGLNEYVVSADGAPSVQLRVTGIETHPVPVPDHPVVIGKVAELPCTTGLGLCAPTVTELMSAVPTLRVAEAVPPVPSLELTAPVVFA